MSPEMNKHIQMVNAVAKACNISQEDAWKEIVHARQNYEENIAYDSPRAYEYLSWALQDLGLESDFTEEFLTELPYEPIDMDQEDEDEEPEHRALLFIDIWCNRSNCYGTPADATLSTTFGEGPWKLADSTIFNEDGDLQDLQNYVLDTILDSARQYVGENIPIDVTLTTHLYIGEKITESYTEEPIVKELEDLIQ